MVQVYACGGGTTVAQAEGKQHRAKTAEDRKTKRGKGGKGRFGVGGIKECEAECVVSCAIEPAPDPHPCNVLSNYDLTQPSCCL